MSVLIAHPSTAPFVQQAARALHEGGVLAAYHTTVAHQPGRQPQRALAALGRIAGAGLHEQFARRQVNEVPESAVRTWPWRELLRLAVAKADRSGRLADTVWEWAELAFDRHVARALGGGVTAVYGYEHCAAETFAAARARGLACVYDVPAPEPAAVNAILAREVARFPVLDTPLYRHNRTREPRRAERRRREWELADRVIAASTFTRTTFAAAGRDTAKVRIVPYGAPPVASRDEALAPRPATDPLRVLWAGTFSVRKGAHYVIEAWRRERLGAHARLRIFGTNGLPPALYQPWPDGVEFRGPVSRAELMDEYRQADVLLFPTLCDGYGMVASEAWSRGCPVIMTECAGAADLLEPGRNGLLIRAGDADAIVESITWCLAHRSELAAMREVALATAARWQWSDYRRALLAAVRELPGLE